MSTSSTIRPYVTLPGFPISKLNVVPRYMYQSFAYNLTVHAVAHDCGLNIPYSTIHLLSLSWE